MTYSYPSNMPASVRPETIRMWNNLWRRLRRHTSGNRRLELLSGARFKWSGVDFRISYQDTQVIEGEREYEGFKVWIEGRREAFFVIEGSCAWGSSKLYTYLDKFQDNLELLLVKQIMTE